MEHMFITNQKEIALCADSIGIERVWIDLEYIGKAERQKNMDTVKSKHSIEDIKLIKPLLKHSKLQVRINPIHSNSKYEIDKAIEYGADYIMLPMFRTSDDVKIFIKYVQKRCKTILLFETDDSVKNIDEILNISGIDEVHIGLNDLHLCYHLDFMFELLTNGIVEYMCEKFKEKGIPFGVGGVARLDAGTLKANLILKEFYRLGATRVILSRGFVNVKDISLYMAIQEMTREFAKIKNYEDQISKLKPNEFDENKILLTNSILNIVNDIRSKK